MVSLRKKLTLLPLVAATYFMVAGGPYGLEELVRQAGFLGSVLILLVTPLAWSLPTALMVGELASALPDEGGYYVWVKRALGPFWGFQEAWLSLSASVFDMAIYPSLFVIYLARLWPTLGQGWAAVLIGMGVVLACAVMNLRGSRSVGRASIAMGVLLLAPFVVMGVGAFWHPVISPQGAAPGADWLGGLLIAMWNFMGWDNATTVAGEVERPQRTYPLAILGTLALVTLTYVIPVIAAARVGLPAEQWTTGAWVEVARRVGGSGLALLVVLGGMICGLGMMNALVMSYSRLPMVMAQDGFFPRWFARRLPSNGSPWFSIVVLSVAWSAALGLGIERLVELDVILYGLALVLEFVALVVLRLREPRLARPFRVPGGLPVAVSLGLGPTALLALALVHEQRPDRLGSLLLAIGLVAAGFAVYFVAKRFGMEDRREEEDRRERTAS